MMAGNFFGGKFFGGGFFGALQTGARLKKARRVLRYSDLEERARLEARLQPIYPAPQVVVMPEDEEDDVMVLLAKVLH